MKIRTAFLGTIAAFSMASIQVIQAQLAIAEEVEMCGHKPCSNLPGLGQGCCPFSDQRLKENIEPLQGSVEKLLTLHGVSYAFKIDQKKDIGLLAQNVEAVYPELVQETDGYKRVDYEKLVAPLIEAVRELNQRIELLEKEG